MTIDPDDVHILWCAMLAMVEDIHAAQDSMTEEQWARAQEILADLTRAVEATRAMRAGVTA